MGACTGMETSWAAVGAGVGVADWPVASVIRVGDTIFTARTDRYGGGAGGAAEIANTASTAAAVTAAPIVIPQRNPPTQRENPWPSRYARQARPSAPDLTGPSTNRYE